MEVVSWSPKFNEIRDRVLYIKLSMSRKLGRKVGARLLTKLSKQTGINTENLTVKDTENMLKEAYKEYKEVKENHKKIRGDHIEDLARVLKKQKKGRKANLIRHIVTTEEKQQTYRKLGYINKKMRDLHTTYVTVKDKEGITTEISEKKQMEEAIIKENTQKYHQTEKTCPFLKKSSEEPLWTTWKRSSNRNGAKWKLHHTTL